jgi:WD40 repeat protein
VRVWDLATGAPAGDPFTGHAWHVRAVAAAELDGRPVIISASDDGTVRVWDLATRAPAGDPFTGHTGWVGSVAAAELGGRPVVISGGNDKTVRVWDLASGTPIGDPFTSHAGAVLSLAIRTVHGSKRVGASAQVGVGAANVAAVSSITDRSDGTLRWKQIAAPQLHSNVLALAWVDRGVLVAGTDVGIVVLDFPNSSNAGFELLLA